MKVDKPTITTLKVVASAVRPLSLVSQEAARLVSQIDSLSLSGIYGNSPIKPPGEMSAADWFAFNILRKFPFKGIDRRNVAISSFKAMELQCHDTNTRIKELFRKDKNFRDAIFGTRAEILRCLGPFCWNQASNYFAWGPGATTRLTNREGDVYYKFRGKPETTLANLPLASAAIGQIPLWYGEIHPLRMSDLCTVVPGSKVTTVPKSAKTDRTIAIEPCMNMYVQKGIGTMIRSRLKRVGVDLSDQGHNQNLAKEAYSMKYATIDLAAASDTVSYELVDLLLPDDWLSALKRCRSHRYTLDRVVSDYHKFSTMGNGYTFELESLIFWATTLYVLKTLKLQGSPFGIYGDDIIVPQDAAQPVIDALTAFGFTTNVEKSFVTGSFYESCGKHYLRGEDITPVYVDDRVNSPSRLLWFANSIARWGGRSGVDVSQEILQEMWLPVVSMIPENHRLSIPDGVGDGGLVVPVCSGFSARTVSTVTPFWKHKKSCSGYQRGYSFTHWVDHKVDTRDRDPQDVPYLLRGLYKLPERFSPLDVLSKNLSTVQESGIIQKRKWKKARGWSSSWEVPTW